MGRIPAIILCCALAAAMPCCGKKKDASSKQGGGPAPGDIVEIISEDGYFSTLAAAIDAAGLAETLADEGPFTLLAPPDSVFAKLPPGTAESLLQDIPALKSILLYHIIPGKLSASDLGRLPTAATLLGEPLAIEAVRGGGIVVSGARIVRGDVPAANGAIHVIDRLLLPPEKSAK